MSKLKGVEARTTTQYQAIITLEELLEAFDLPEDAEVTVRVPGGEWSNEDVRLHSKENSNGQFDEIRVTWQVTKEHQIKGKRK